MFQEKVRLYRFRNQVRMLGKAQSMMKEAGLDPHEVPLRVLLPLLEGASIEEEESLVDRWAALLANAAADGACRVPPSFPKILGQLDSPDVVILEVLHKNYLVDSERSEEDRTEEEARLIEEGKHVPWGTTLEKLHHEACLVTLDTIQLSLDNLMGLGLVDRNPLLRVFQSDNVVFTPKAEYRLTSLGVRFVTTCSPPNSCGS